MRAAVLLTIGISGTIGTSLALDHTWTWKHVAMPVVSLLDAETAHHVAVRLASWGCTPRDRTSDFNSLRSEVWGLKFSNPIGLAAGFDKHAECYCGMFKIGFGFVEVGSVTPLPQSGNPLPRVFRLSADKAIINRYGFNSVGHSVVASHLNKWLKKRISDKQLGVNLGKNKDSSDAAKDYVQGVQELGRYSDYLVINVSSPNTPGLRKMQGREELGQLLDKVVCERDKLHPHRPPLLVKIAPDLSMEGKEDIAAVVSRKKGGADGIIISNTTITRPEYLQCSEKQERGGLSGEPLKEVSTQAISDMYKLTKGQLPIIGVGGVSSGQDAFKKIAAGASLVQLYTALVYEGPPLVARIKKELADILRENGYTNVQQVVGSAHAGLK